MTPEQAEHVADGHATPDDTHPRGIRVPDPVIRAETIAELERLEAERDRLTAGQQPADDPPADPTALMGIFYEGPDGVMIRLDDGPDLDQLPGWTPRDYVVLLALAQHAVTRVGAALDRAEDAERRRRYRADADAQVAAARGDQP